MTIRLITMKPDLILWLLQTGLFKSIDLCYNLLEDRKVNR